MSSKIEQAEETAQGAFSRMNAAGVYLDAGIVQTHMLNIGSVDEGSRYLHRAACRRVVAGLLRDYVVALEKLADLEERAGNKALGDTKPDLSFGRNAPVEVQRELRRLGGRSHEPLPSEVGAPGGVLKRLAGV